MTEKVQTGDFVAVDYTGKLTDGTIFDTTQENVAKENGLFNPQVKYKPAEICVGQKQILPGLDEQLVDKEIGKEFTFTLAPENAFGKRDVKKMKIVPMNIFKEHKVQPQPGLQIDVDGERGIVSRISGGRVIVNFNHPLAGKEVVYTVIVKDKINDKKQQISAFLSTMLGFPKESMTVSVTDDKAVVEMPAQLPEQFSTALNQKISELVKVKSVEFKTKAPAKKAEN